MNALADFLKFAALYLLAFFCIIGGTFFLFALVGVLAGGRF